MYIWHITIKAINKEGSEREWDFYGSATCIDVAIRQARRSAKRQEFHKIEIISAMQLGDKDW